MGGDSGTTEPRGREAVITFLVDLGWCTMVMEATGSSELHPMREFVRLNFSPLHNAGSVQQACRASIPACCDIGGHMGTYSRGPPIGFFYA